MNSDDETVNIVPFIYALLPGKSTSTYVRLFELVKEHFDIVIDKYRCDFEPAQYQAIKIVFPNVSVAGCYFHFSKAVKYNAKKIGLSDTAEGRITTVNAANLPLLPGARINEGWIAIVQESNKSEKMARFQLYFERQWIKLMPTMISCAGDTHRTNNGLEGWHRRLNARVPPNCTLILFLQKLKKEATWQARRLKNHLFNKNNRAKNDILFNRRYRQELEKLNNNIITPLEVLNNVRFLKMRMFREVEQRHD